MFYPFIIPIRISFPKKGGTWLFFLIKKEVKLQREKEKQVKIIEQT